jgi:hypothetical protein
MKFFLRQYNRSLAAIIIFIFPVFLINPQEALLSDTEKYYSFLSLRGLTERAYLNYRTLSDSVWDIDEQAAHPWQGQYLGGKKSLGHNIFYRIYGPELFSSYNTDYPYGYNDGALWQGKGFNTSFSGGVRLEGYGAELTFKPQLAFSQNLDFSYMESNIGNGFGYFWVMVDAPQRFGDEPFFSFDWGDSEIRYTWRTITIGFGTQAVWLGPALIDPILHSNNAPSYPKLDIGLRRTSVSLPWLNWYIGDIEFRTFWGRLTESDYFDNDSSNDNNLITGLSLSYAPSFMPGFAMGFHRTMLSKWADMDYDAVITLLSPFMQEGAGSDRRDQRASLTFNYLFPTVGFELYFEWGINDYSPNLGYLVRYPFHTQAYTFGSRKHFSFKPDLRGELILEITNLESSRDYEFLGKTTFYAHHIINHGYTNKGQWLGAGFGTGGNSQYFGFTLFYHRGYASVFIQRQNIDNDYIWYMHMGQPVLTKREDQLKMKALMSFGIDNSIRLHKHIAAFSKIVYSSIFNPKYEIDTHAYNLHLVLGIDFIF